jgi:hypothetical protein
MFTPTHTVAGSGGKTTSVNKKLLGPMMNSLGIPKWEDSWMVHLPGIFEEMGLGDIEVVEMGEPRREMWSYWAASSLVAAHEISMPGFAERDEVLREMDEEFERGVYAWATPRVVVGRKGV